MATAADKERLHINLGEQSQQRLARLMDTHESNRTSTVTRALRIYEFFDELEASGGIYSRTESGEFYRVRLL